MEKVCARTSDSGHKAIFSDSEQMKLPKSLRISRPRKKKKSQHGKVIESKLEVN